MMTRRLVRPWNWNEMSIALHSARSIGKKGVVWKRARVMNHAHRQRSGDVFEGQGV